MSGINKVILIGNLGKDPEVRYLEGGTAVANINLATTENYKDRTSGEWQSQTEWHRVVLWRNLAERAEKYLKTGMQVYVEGKLRTRSWEDKEKNKQYTTEIVADKLTILGRKDDNQNSGNASAGSRSSENSQTSAVNEPKTPSVQQEDDDLPF